MTSTLLYFAQWIGHHPTLAGVIIFLVALSESLALLGLVVPGALMMTAAGALIGIGALQFWPIFGWSVAGAIAGDGISFWLGFHYRDGLRRIRPFRAHPEWVARAEDFIQTHGGKSVLLGRFIGPIRPIVPAVAGMMGMKPPLFVGINIISAFAWAPIYLLPGMAFGASLALAGQVSSRLAALFALLAIVVLIVIWIGRHLFRVVRYSAAAFAERALAWSSQHRIIGKFLTDLLDPNRPPSRALLLIAGLLVVSGWTFFGILEDVVTGDPLVRADRSVYEFLLQLRSSWGDQVMIFFTELGDAAILTPISICVILWLIWRREWRASVYWVSAIAFGVIATATLKFALKLPRPISVYHEGVSIYGFPSGHTTMSTVIFGFLAVLLAQGMTTTYRWIPYVTASLLIIAIAFSRLYLGAHWLSDVLGGATLGTAWVAFLSIAYLRHQVPAVPMKGLRYTVIIVFVAAAAWHVSRQYSLDLKRYEPQYRLRHMEFSAWWDQAWQSLPANRIDLGGELEQPMNIQWAGSLDRIRNELTAAGWKNPMSLSPSTALHWLLPSPDLSDLPILPQLHSGQKETLLMVYPLDGKHLGEQLIIRLWPSQLILIPDYTPLWIGYVAHEALYNILFLHVPHTGNDLNPPAFSQFEHSLKGTTFREVTHAPGRSNKEFEPTLLVRGQ